MKHSEKEQSVKRLQSIDALRGFDMCWIMGFPAIIYALNSIFGGDVWMWTSEQMEHVPWDGFHFMDLIFPLFLFIAGVSFPFSLDKRHAAKEPNSKIYGHIVKRAFLLVLFGAIYNGFLNFNFDSTRYASVLAHIGLAWFFAALIFMHIDRKYVIGSAWIAGIIVGYGLLTLFVLAPDATGTNPFVPENNISCWFDRMFLPGVLYREIFDPEGLLSLVPATATALIGMLSGNYLKEKKPSPTMKAKILCVVGFLMLATALIAGMIIPFNKALWSSSFTLLTGSISILLLALFYWVIDVRQFTRWTFFFRVVGMNSITIYMAKHIIDFQGINTFFLGGLASKLSPGYGSLLLSLGYVACCWLFLYFLYKKKIFLKV
ncbi:MAG: DUF5009 domain-containing protein [Bacteroidales bacterium]|nr:DUF5009 domain-containing protein [Bacteroidales bacterium]